jgi:hypothetical protein
MQNFNIWIYNCTGKPFNLTMSSNLSDPDKQTNPKTYDAIPPCNMNCDPTFYQLQPPHPYNTFTVVGTSNEYFGKTDIYGLGEPSTFPPDNQWFYTIAVGISPDKFVDASGNDVSVLIKNIIGGDTCVNGSGTCGYLYVSEYPSWFTNLFTGLGMDVSLKNIIMMLVIVIMAIIIGAIAIAVMMKYRKGAS